MSSSSDHVPAYLQSHVLAGDELQFSLDDQVRALQADLKPGGRAAVTLSKEHGLSVVLMAMAGGNRVDDHETPGVVTVQVLSGRVSLARDGESTDAPAGSLVVFGPSVRHAIEAHEDSAILVTVALP